MRTTSVVEPQELRERMVRKRHAIDLMELSFAEDAALFAAKGDYDELGYVSGIDWIRFNCHMTSGTAADRVAVGETMHRMPKSIEAVGQVAGTEIRRPQSGNNVTPEGFGRLQCKLEPLRITRLVRQYEHLAPAPNFESRKQGVVHREGVRLRQLDLGLVPADGQAAPLDFRVAAAGIGGAELEVAA